MEKMNVEPFEDEGGVTGIGVLSTSHCAVHTWPLRSFFVMDVYSCRDFDVDIVRAMVGDRSVSGCASPTSRSRSSPISSVEARSHCPPPR